MAELFDTVNKQLSTSIEFQRGMAAFLSASADNEQRALDACVAMAAERDDYKKKYEDKCTAYDDKCDECDDLRSQLAEARALIAQLTQKPLINLTLKGKAKVDNIITGDLHKFYAEDNSNTRQLNSRIGIGG